MPTIGVQYDHWNDVEKPALMQRDDWDIEKGEWKQSEPAGCGLAVAMEVAYGAFVPELVSPGMPGWDLSELQEAQHNEALDDAYSEYQAELSASGDRFMTTQEANEYYSNDSNDCDAWDATE